MKIIGNKIKNGKRAVCIQGSVQNIVVLNNFICGSDYAVYIDRSVNNNYIYHNSFYNSNTNIYATNLGSGSIDADWYIKNNIFHNTSSSSANTCINWNSANTPEECNYNIFYTPNGAGVGELSGTTYGTLANWQAINHQITGGNGDGNSVNTDPNFDNTTTCNLCQTTGFQSGEDLPNPGGLVDELEEDYYEEDRIDNTIGACEESSVLPIELLDFHADKKSNFV